MTQTATPQKSGRLLALDILRGITIAGMILVNNPGSWGSIYAPLRHAEWNGLTPTDLVFPFFMFIMGVSTYFSLRKYDFSFSWPTLIKIIRRTIVIFAIGIGIAWLSLFLRGIASEKSLFDAIFNFSNIRILGVMPRLAICYCAASIIAITLKHKYLPIFTVGLLVLYSIILLTGNGFEFSDSNVISIVDHKILGPNHMYADTIDGVRLKFDPEGLLSTLPSIAHVLIGFWMGMLLTGTKDNNLRINYLFIAGTILTFSGFLIDFGLPINKKIWSPTFVLTTCGLASSFLGLLIWIIDIKGYKKWCRFFEVFGINPLFMYVLGAVLSILIGFIKVPSSSTQSGMISLKGSIYTDFLVPLCQENATLASLIFAILFVCLNWCVGYVLYKKKIYIKI
ncbi:MAG: heparan-alpha-glucosaminide N-acetyltransferase domain-containing protein [Muribaculaceae bacterium]|nr:heparan-alpha-glucosaminide N-acetyltransferase domain-containing protein [Muribaculaceae bacterium]